MKVAIMQPYAFPYIGYFQLINAVDTFVFYDDVNYIKGGWINRNNILIKNTPFLFTIPLQDPSSFKLINEICINYQNKLYKNILKTIEQGYTKAPFFAKVFPLVQEIFSCNNSITISNFAIKSIKLILDYLEIKKTILVSSESFSHTKGLDRSQRLIQICKELQATTYINPIGGQELYTKADFSQHNLNLYFIKTNHIIYKQFSTEFTPWLSIIDVLMFNDKDQVIQYLNDFELM